ncbi:MAG TPA: gamma-glutamyl-phosphate reductase, partial [Burkholderiales bacterium]|nr:gamma-glutamyl-phosphate reductase [Burkholderiales bacterium]
MQVKAYMRELGRGARAAARELARADTAAKDRALARMAAEIRAQAKAILAANAADVKQAKKAGRNAAFVERLAMTANSVEQMAEGVEQVAGLADPVG